MVTHRLASQHKTAATDIRSQTLHWCFQATLAGATVRQASEQMRQRPARPKAVFACNYAYDCLFAAVNLLHRCVTLLARLRPQQLQHLILHAD